jgi:hypothetical protein
MGAAMAPGQEAIERRLHGHGGGERTATYCTMGWSVY